MRVAFLLSEFPVLSETFILSQITGLIRRGCEVDVFAETIRPLAKAHPDVIKYALLDRAYSLARPAAANPRKLTGLAAALKDVARTIPLGPRAVARSFDLGRFGADAAKLRIFYRVAAFLRRAPYDLIHCHFGPNGQLACLLKDLGATRAPIVTQFHGYDVSSFIRQNGKQVYRDLFDKGDLFLCVSDRIRARIVDLGCEPTRAVVHRVGVDVDELRFHRTPIDVGGPLRVLTVGRLEEKKGIEYGIRAVNGLRSRYPRLKYTIIGDGSLRQSLTDLVRQLGAEAQVELVGWMLSDQVRAQMARADVLLVPSVTASNGDEEGVPTVLMEALAAGLPVVASSHAGIPELVLHGESGLLAQERSSEGLAQQLEYLFTHPEHAAAMSERGRQMVELRHDAERLNDELLALYQGLVRGSV